MDMQIMLKQMCKSELNDSDLKAICKSRGFPAKASRDIFENFFISTIGLKEALNSLTCEEVVFLHLLNKINEEVDIEYFERLYGCASGYGYRTFNQRYKETFKNVKNNLVRKGVLIFMEQETYSSSTRLERLRFRFPPEFADFLPPIARASKFEEAGISRERYCVINCWRLLEGSKNNLPYQRKDLSHSLSKMAICLLELKSSG